ncbi:hypothetical protein HPP92_010862 [Vanilla planifolia]|uniref:AT hook motif-containing protein n=1 Tax=Vanilla planifolia TaxID=51239 RepID=A0A835RAH1_VANPL|nr:hypothetical protein HPP92_010862 [Vanilla planifolia]
MSVASANQEMAQPNQLNDSGDMSAAPIKRKRGRPRKDEVSESESKRSTQQRVVRPTPSYNHSLVGQKVSGSLVGVFDAGYLLNVQVGSTGPKLRGLVFDPCLSIPVSAENDVAPHLPMLRRDGSSLPVAEGFVHHRDVSLQTHLTRTPSSSIQNLQAKEPSSSTFTAQVLDAVHPNLMEVTPSHGGHAFQPTSGELDLELVSRTSMGIQDEQSHLTSSMPSQSHFPKETVVDVSRPSDGSDLLDTSLVIRSDVSNVSNAAITSKQVSLDLSKLPDDSPADEFKETPPSNSFELSGVSMEATAHASHDPSNSRKVAMTPFTDLSLNVSLEVPLNIPNSSDAFKEAPYFASKPSDAQPKEILGIAQKFNLEKELSDPSQKAAFDASKLSAAHTLAAGSRKEEDFSAQRMEESLQIIDESIQNPKADDPTKPSEMDLEIDVRDKIEDDGNSCSLTQIYEPQNAVQEKLEEGTSTQQASTAQN